MGLATLVGAALVGVLGNGGCTPAGQAFGSSIGAGIVGYAAKESIRSKIYPSQNTTANSSVNQERLSEDYQSLVLNLDTGESRLVSGRNSWTSVVNYTGSGPKSGYKVREIVDGEDHRILWLQPTLTEEGKHGYKVNLWSDHEELYGKE
jgi:hypothetical protein